MTEPEQQQHTLTNCGGWAWNSSGSFQVEYKSWTRGSRGRCSEGSNLSRYPDHAELLLKMMYPGLLPSSFSPLMDFNWPVRSLWPDTRPLFFKIEQEMMRHMQEMRQSMQFMERLHQKIFEEIDHIPASLTFKPISFKVDNQGENFALTLDTKDFTPEELSVKQVGRKLRVSGKTEKKQDDGKGSYSYKQQEFRQELDLPEGVNPEDVTCTLSDGQLQIKALRAIRPAITERVVPIDRVAALKSPEEQSGDVDSCITDSSSSKD
ncbi:heat shock protein beta-11 [Brienomyrus brachyistius]|uniref:heat shock protein beta-11 n=1 Tax=Brienomyrus brachyistius TaxID=42636 RepID=UPI0020B33ED4|nr:heat shock protein beta-11 [Brienomyrus brachyistius]